MAKMKSKTKTPTSGTRAAIMKPVGWQRQRPMRVGDKFTSRQHGKKVILQCTGVMPSYKAKRVS